MDIASLGTILGVWAHPDDEAYLSAAIMALAVRAGSRVMCVTATRGEAGSQDEVRWPPETMAQVRKAELMETLRVLGVTEHRWLDFVDGTCHEVDEDEATAKVAAIFEEVQPDSVLCFGPEGQTGHPDHIATHRWTRRAFHERAKRGAKLYYATTSPEWADRFLPILEPFNVFAPGTPNVTPRDEMGIDFTLEDPELIELKMRALKQQASQTEGLIAAFGEENYKAAFSEETFALAEEK